MDRNTITGLILIFVIFIGFSIYSTSQKNKAFEKAIAVAESDYKNGNLDAARTEYVNALRLNTNQPDAIAKLNEINLKLGNTPEKQNPDTLNARQINSDKSVTNPTGAKTDINQY